ncbi:MAG TPA: PEGA domain-containing protein [Sandaracinaceae bacterium LLY-WYZ-13_1]|nr:PEGA domain-containing protein [Sandaracinaceae bacterium LLY-WYZ-13_1]
METSPAPRPNRLVLGILAAAALAVVGVLGWALGATEQPPSELAEVAGPPDGLETPADLGPPQRGTPVEDGAEETGGAGSTGEVGGAGDDPDERGAESPSVDGTGPPGEGGPGDATDPRAGGSTDDSGGTTGRGGARAGATGGSTPGAGETDARARDQGAGTDRAAQGGDDAREAAAGQATLTVNATPWAEVELDGRSLGSTPQRRVSVSPGSHTLELSCPPLGRRARTTFEAAPGQRLSAFADLSAESPSLRVR